MLKIIHMIKITYVRKSPKNILLDKFVTGFTFAFI